MGLETTHDCYHGSYTLFYEWRQMLCCAAGLEFDCNIRGRSMAEQSGHWDETPDEILFVLIDHADYEGFIAHRHLGPLADRLTGLLPQIGKLQESGAGDRDGIIVPPGPYRAITERFINGLRAAAAKGDEVCFG